MIQPKACEFAAARGLTFEIASLHADQGTVVGRGDREERSRGTWKAFAGDFLGLGTVGLACTGGYPRTPRDSALSGAGPRPAQGQGEAVDPAIFVHGSQGGVRVPLRSSSSRPWAEQSQLPRCSRLRSRGASTWSRRTRRWSPTRTELERVAASRGARFLSRRARRRECDHRERRSAARVEILSIEAVLKRTTNYILDNSPPDRCFPGRAQGARGQGVR